MKEGASALLLRDFVNTYDVDCDIDDFGAPWDLSGWLVERGLTPPGARADEADLALAVAFREGLRHAMLGHHTPDAAGPPADLDRILTALPLRVSLNGPALLPLAGGVRGGLAAIAAAVMRSVAEGDWTRLKVCRETTCRWAFLDTSKNRSRSWCSMRMCGNRTKTRAYRARRRAASPGT
ncbi:CGNR zinc finger domain-containing protein [Actinoallomurus soli]|uniref:CGNR zinc finger domain-containing protein n=1 Tax=Actinoallomurus soli TaxID=2952535 RepID=UPI002093086C|nr:CGNR zinc finger domain-containing protein [Actinoallomurus soli]MCO5966794.1 CGNR zinc finger domain-containing protein [Actinoallomurus soli]